MSRIVVLGGTGMLGRALLAILRERGAQPLAPDRAGLDLERTDALDAALAALRPAVVINAAAYTDVAGAERPDQRGAVWALNRDAPAALARAAAGLGARLVHVSTDYVFDGETRRPYREDDPVRPLQEYGKSKLAGERAVLAADPAALVVRTSTLYGLGPRARPHYVDAVLRQARRGAPLTLVRAPVSSPTYAGDLALAIVELLDTDATGLVHAVNGGGCTRIELAEEALRLAGLAGRVRIAEREEPAGGLARPAYSVLDTSRLARLLGRPPRPWQEALRDYLEAGGG